MIDPLVLIDEFGTDALRFTMLVGSSPGNDTNVGPKKVEGNRNFANKIWNVGRFVINALDTLTPPSAPLSHVGRGAEGEGYISPPPPLSHVERGAEGVDYTPPPSPLSHVERGTEGEGHTPPPPPLSHLGRGAGGEGWTLADSWIWARLQQLVRDVERLFQTFQYGEAGKQIYEFLWSDFADWYVEVANGQLADGKSPAAYRTADTLVRVFDMTLRLLHPFTPFVTEELWGHLRTATRDSALAPLTDDWPEALIVAAWPEARESEGWEESKIADFELVQEIVRSIRNLRAEKGVAPGKRLAATIVAGGKMELLQEQSKVLAALAGLSEAELTIVGSLADKPGDTFALVIGSVEVYLPLAGMVDLAAEKTRLEKELKEAASHIERLEKLLASDFANKAPAALVQKERDKLAAYKETAEKINAQLK